MLKWLVAIVLVLAVLSVAGCCCCSSSGLSNGYYSTVSQDKTAANCACDTPYDCSSVACDGACTCHK